MLVVTKDVFCREKNNACHDKRRVLSRQTRVYRDKTFVATKMIPAAAPANKRCWAVSSDDVRGPVVEIVCQFARFKRSLFTFMKIWEKDWKTLNGV